MSDRYVPAQEVVHREERKSGAGPLAAVIVTVLLVIFGFWAVSSFLANDGTNTGVTVEIAPPEGAPNAPAETTP
jgi:cytochrome b